MWSLAVRSFFQLWRAGGALWTYFRIQYFELLENVARAEALGRRPLRWPSVIDHIEACRGFSP
jgi:hypothetical protein